ncbi:hypothetical protein GDO81_020089 [Engystomops pustulosus]|uniref:Secreted protein n=1 Tax=Engystomops pustulosus TaxID=76066 RepID=A0AAV6Z0U5_ENGPU|nr:hypothetical protein GDO81_020089 [Engystomops pustulosus]
MLLHLSLWMLHVQAGYNCIYCNTTGADSLTIMMCKYITLIIVRGLSMLSYITVTVFVWCVYNKNRNLKEFPRCFIARCLTPRSKGHSVDRDWSCCTGCL